MRDLITAAAHSGGSDAGIDVANFLIDRLKVQQREAGIRHDMIDAVVSVTQGGDNVLMVKRVRALQGFVTTDEGANLLAGYKRGANILKQSGDAEAGMANHVQHDGASAVEMALKSALDDAEPKAAAAIEAEDFEGAMTALATLRAPIDAFFEGVMVNDPDPAVRAFRLGLLTRFRDAVHHVADFTKIEG
jgi:glycyl-tRNA synthetase beta chain